MSEDFATRQVDGLVEMVVTGRWSSRAEAVVVAEGVDRLVLNYALGFDEESLDFLRGLPIAELKILDRRLTDLQPIYALAPTLRRLSAVTHPRLLLDVGRLPHLTRLSADWRQVSETIESVPGLRHASFGHYYAPDLTPLRPLRDLREIVMKDRPRIRTLDGVSDLPSLEVLQIHGGSLLADIGEISRSPQLLDLAITGARRIDHLDPLTACTRLHELNISENGAVASLRSLAPLAQLRALHMHGSTKVLDDDLSPLLALPDLRTLSIQSRRSYRPSVQDVETILATRRAAGEDGEGR